MARNVLRARPKRLLLEAVWKMSWLNPNNAEDLLYYTNKLLYIRTQRVT